MMLQLHNRQNDLRQSEQLMRELIDNAPIGMLVVDDQLRVQQANPAAARLFGCPPEDLLGQRPEDRLFDADASERLLRLPANTPLQMTGRRGDAQIPLRSPVRRSNATARGSTWCCCATSATVCVPNSGCAFSPTSTR